MFSSVRGRRQWCVGGDGDGVACAVMMLVENGAVMKQKVKQAPLPEDKARKYFRHLILGLEYRQCRPRCAQCEDNHTLLACALLAGSTSESHDSSRHQARECACGSHRQPHGASARMRARITFPSLRRSPISEPPPPSTPTTLCSAPWARRPSWRRKSSQVRRRRLHAE